MSQPAEQIPNKLGPYRIIKEVGAGGLGRVFRAIDERNGHTVAVKVLHDKLLQQKRFLGIFHRELLIMSRLHHSHIVSYRDSYFQPPLCYVVTDYIEGWSGYAFMKAIKKAPPLVAISIIVDILQGIDHLHLHDTVHSDLSAANFMIDHFGRVYVMDFGLSCQMEIEDYKDYMVGTPGYYSPEHISSTPMGTYTDIYCTGLLLYELLTGRKAVPVHPDRHEVLNLMKRINFDLIHIKHRKMQKMIRSMLKDALQFSIQKRTQTADIMIYQCFDILKMFGIRFTRYVIHKYMMDIGLVKGDQIDIGVDIYTGFQR